MTFEHYVSPEVAAKHLGIRRKHLLDLARGGMAGCYPIGNGQFRKRWVFKLSELEGGIDPKRRGPTGPTGGTPPLCPKCRARRDIVISDSQFRPLNIRRPIDRPFPRGKSDGR